MGKKSTLLVIGGGAAGMVAAWRASSTGSSVLLLEKNAQLGIKILISGGGKCNITNSSDVKTMLKQFQKNESRFLKYAFHEFTNFDLLELLRTEGVETYARENGKVFPKSHDAEEVVSALRRVMETAGVEILLQSPVKEIRQREDGKYSITSGRNTHQADAVIIASGGASYRKTGTTGDGYRWLQELGHTIVPIRPALTPIVLTPLPASSWQGTPIRDCELLAVNGTEVVSRWNGDVLITHFGISGPATLEVSRNAYLVFEQGKKIDMCVDFFPELTIEQLDEKLSSELQSNPSRNILTLAEQLVPQRLAEYLLVNAAIIHTKKLNQISKTERSALVKILKRCPLGTVKDIPLDRGEVTAGGVSLNEVDPTTMESKLRKGLYLCGEILDIAGPVGGYNLQAAFSTGFVAGSHAGKNTSLQHH
ncbi:MAG: NAD(P)/FAD-dependent oxidoreductase [Bacteroidota bacterium]